MPPLENVNLAQPGLTRAAIVGVTASGEFSAGYAKARAIDNDFSTLWASTQRASASLLA